MFPFRIKFTNRRKIYKLKINKENHNNTHTYNIQIGTRFFFSTFRLDAQIYEPEPLQNVQTGQSPLSINLLKAKHQTQDQQKQRERDKNEYLGARRSAQINS